jgi:hypothetical protein
MLRALPVIAAAMMLAACVAPVTPAVAGPVQTERGQECRAACAGLGMQLTSVVLIMNSAGCVCQVNDPPPRADGGGAAAAMGGAAIAAVVAKQREDEAARQRQQDEEEQKKQQDDQKKQQEEEQRRQQQQLHPTQ